MKKKYIHLEPVGAISIPSGKVVVSDPCYKLDVWCMGTVDNLRPGEYEVCYYAGDPEDIDIGRCFYINHTSEPAPTRSTKWITKAGEFGMDAGMGCIYDYDEYAVTHNDDRSFDRFWDEVCSDRDICHDGIRVYPKGVICPSGYGDGGFEVKLRYNADEQVIGVMVLF